MKLSASFRHGAVTAVLVNVVAACGGSDTPVVANTASASAAVMSTAALHTSVTGSNGSGAAGSLHAAGQAAQSIVQPDGGAQLTALNQALADATAGTLVGAAPGDCICTPLGCTFDQCTSGGAFTIDGTIRIVGDTYTFDVTIDVVDASIDYTWIYAGMLTLTPTLIDGTLSASGDGSVTGNNVEINYTFDWSTTFNQVALDNGCPVGGSLDAEASYDVAGVSGAGNYSGAVSVSFGPGCGQVTAN